MNSINNYQRRDFLRRSLYVAMSVGLPKPVLAALGTTNEAVKETAAAQYFRFKILRVHRPPTFEWYKPGELISFNNTIDHVRVPQVSDDGENWRDAEPCDLEANGWIAVYPDGSLR